MKQGLHRPRNDHQKYQKRNESKRDEEDCELGPECPPADDAPHVRLVPLLGQAFKLLLDVVLLQKIFAILDILTQDSDFFRFVIFLAKQGFILM